MKKKISKEQRKIEKKVIRDRNKLLRQYKKATKEPIFRAEEKVVMKYIAISFLVGIYVINIAELILNVPFMREALLIINLLTPFALGLVIAIAIFFNRKFL